MMKRQSSQEQNVQEGGRETKEGGGSSFTRVLRSPMYATWVGACHTHPRAHSHTRRAPAPARPISTRLWAPGLNRPRHHLLPRPQ